MIEMSLVNTLCHDAFFLSGKDLRAVNLILSLYSICFVSRVVIKPK